LRWGTRALARTAVLRSSLTARHHLLAAGLSISNAIVRFRPNVPHFIFRLFSLSRCKEREATAHSHPSSALSQLATNLK
jgi:hypothetical protein